MEKLLEKITLYDFLGFTLPGSILTYTLYCCTSELPREMIQAIHNVWIKAAAFLMVSYVCGICLSELSKCMIKALQTIFKPSSPANSQIDAAIQQYLQSFLKTNNSLSLEEETAIRMIYAIIQTDPKYQRVHNYNSMKSLYKNLFGLFSLLGCYFLIDTFYHFSQIHLSGFIIFGLFFFSWLMYHRYNQATSHLHLYLKSWMIDKMICMQTTNQGGNSHEQDKSS